MMGRNKEAEKVPVLSTKTEWEVLKMRVMFVFV